MARISVQAELNFVVNTGERLVVYPSEGGGRGESKSGSYENRRVSVYNGREDPEIFDLDVQGFTLTQHPSRVTDFYADEQLRSVYDAEIRKLIRSLTGAAEVVVFDHTRRSDDPAVRAQLSIREPAATAHNDYTEASGPRRLRDLLPPEEAERWCANRFAIINVWRPIVGPVVRSPLVLCDARTIDARDLVVTERRARERTGEIYQLACNAAQRWVYFPLLRRDEALVFKCFDSATDGRARFAPHTAFHDPDTPASAAARQSIETRTIVRFPSHHRQQPSAQAD